jgi:hypothetical protein
MHDEQIGTSGDGSSVMAVWIPVEEKLPEDSRPVWIRYENDSGPGFVIGRCEWELEGKPTFPDEARGVVNPVCRMEWTQGKAYFVDGFSRRRISATHWALCDPPEFID